MKRSEINNTVRSASSFFEKNGWVLPPNPRWDVTDFGLGDFAKSGLVLINLAEEKEYCEKLMYSTRNQLTPAHYHKEKKEDIICRKGVLVVRLWKKDIDLAETGVQLKLKINGVEKAILSGEKVVLQSGERVTINAGVWHEFYADSVECIIGEVSTANDDVNDNFFDDERIGRFSEIEEDETPVVRLLSDKN